MQMANDQEKKEWPSCVNPRVYPARGRQLATKSNTKPERTHTRRCTSAPPYPLKLHSTAFSSTASATSAANKRLSVLKYMLAAPTIDLAFPDEEWRPISPAKLYRAASVGSWGVTSFGRGFDWGDSDDSVSPGGSFIRKEDEKLAPKDVSRHLAFDVDADELHGRKFYSMQDTSKISRSHANITPTVPSSLLIPSAPITAEPLQLSPSQSRSPSPQLSTTSKSSRPTPPPSRSPTTPRPRRRSSQHRVSLIAGRVSIAAIEIPTAPLLLPPSLQRTGSSSSFLSVASTRAPSPSQEKESFLGGRSITEFLIEGEIGRGAYGLVKRGREIQADGSVGVSSSSGFPVAWC